MGKILSLAPGIVYASSPNGHRQQYLELFKSLFNLAPVCADASWNTVKTLVDSPRLLFATIDDNVPFFALVAMLRGVLGKPTAALFLRPQQCFNRDRIKFRFKWLIFRMLKKIPKLHLMTVVPFDIEPNYTQVAHEGVYDPQFWDMHDGIRLKRPPETELSNEIENAAAGRNIVCFIGNLDLIKGFDFLSESLANDPAVFETTMIVAAGALSPNSQDSGKKFVAAGGYLVDRIIDDCELESLYGVADMIWSCYAPEYDQASGVFGRAVQFGIPVVVRDGSLIGRFASIVGLSAFSLEFGNTTHLAELLKQEPPNSLHGVELERHVARIGSWRQNSLNAIEASLK